MGVQFGEAFPCNQRANGCVSLEAKDIATVVPANGVG